MLKRNEERERPRGHAHPVQEKPPPKRQGAFVPRDSDQAMHGGAIRETLSADRVDGLVHDAGLDDIGGRAQGCGDEAGGQAAAGVGAGIVLKPPRGAKQMLFWVGGADIDRIIVHMYACVLPTSRK